MNRFLLACLFGLCMTCAFAQGKETGMTASAPDDVLKGFIKNYGSEKVTWKESDGVYEGAFKLIGMPATVWYDSTGHRMKVVVDIKEDQLPIIARNYIDRNHPKAKIARAQKWTDDQKVNTFQADIKLGTEAKTLMFNSRGDLIQ